MCGFVAVVGPNPAHRAEVAARMLDTIRHRGPDDEGIAGGAFATLGFRRLSILDLSPLGHQPMEGGGGRYTIAFNGEIFNFLEVRAELQALGHEFVSTGDTEVLLRAWMQWGEGCLPRLNGMFAFVVADHQRGTLSGARDRFGIKPLFIASAEGCTLLASEIKAIRASGLVPARVAQGLAADYLVDGKLDETPDTLFEGIRSVPPSHCFEIDAQGHYTERRYWQLEDWQEREQADPAQRFAELFEDAMRIHMRSDVPVSVHLSGGMDSTSIACAAARVRAAGAEGPLVAFSFVDAEYDETRYIQDTVAQTGATLVRLQTDARRVWRDLPRVLSFQDEPVHSLTAVVGFQLMELTAQHGIRVVLNGQGADETLGGYPSYFRDGWVTELLEHGLPAAWREVGRYAQARGGPAMRLFVDLLRHVAQSRLRALPTYRGMAMQRYRRATAAMTWLRPEVRERASGYPDAQAPDLRSTLMRSIRTSPLPLYLRVEDRNSMAHSVEARVPFLDHRLVEFEMSLGRAWKLDADMNKVLLRKAMRGRIPDSVLQRKEKWGFPTPKSRWMRTTLAPELMELFGSLPGSAGDYLDAQALQALLKAHVAGQVEASQPLFRAAQWALWLQHSERPTIQPAPAPLPLAA